MSPSRILLALIVLLGTLALPAPMAGAAGAACQRGLGVRLADAPAGTRDPRALSYITDHVAPGKTYDRRVEVCNGTGAPVSLRFYANAAVVENGGFRILEGRVGNELSSWISVAPAGRTLAPNERVTLTATIAVPADAEAGERYAVVLAELPPEPNGQGVGVASRIGVRVYLDVGAGAAPRSDFRVDSLQASRSDDGRPLVTARVQNTGGRALDLSGSLSLTDGPGGLSGGPFPAQLGTTLAPGDSAPVLIPLDSAIRGGPWAATLTLRSGLLERRARAEVTFPDGAGGQNAPVAAEDLSPVEDPDLVVPFAIVLIALLFLALIVLGYLTSRRKARERESAG